MNAPVACDGRVAACSLTLPMLETAVSDTPKDPLHGMTLEAILVALHARYGWEGLAERVDIRCFSNDPSIKSSLSFLRKTPWARSKVEALYVQSCTR